MHLGAEATGLDVRPEPAQRLDDGVDERLGDSGRAAAIQLGRRPFDVSP